MSSNMKAPSQYLTLPSPPLPPGLWGLEYRDSTGYGRKDEGLFLEVDDFGGGLT